jgi:hypothetical protein
VEAEGRVGLAGEGLAKVSEAKAVVVEEGRAAATAGDGGTYPLVVRSLTEVVAGPTVPSNQEEAWYLGRGFFSMPL